MLMPTGHVQRFVSQLTGLQTDLEFRQVLGDALSGIGYSQFSYVGGLPERERGKTLIEIEPDLVNMTNRPDWGRRYIDENYGKHDPIVRGCFSSRLPIRWTESIRASARTPEEARMIEDAWENGIRQGFTLPLYGPGGEVGLLMLSCSEKAEEFARLTDEFEYDIHVMAYYFHLTLHRTLQKKVEPPIGLTDRELEVLKWTAEGKTAREISSILTIAERTVNFHVRTVMRKLKVRNKAHAVARAMSSGLLQW